MNTQNYASLEASKRLHDAVIMLKTEAYWIRVANSPMMLVDNRHGADEYYPAPSMAEVWRELPISTEIFKIKDESIAWYAQGRFKSANPTDALIDLLIFVRKEITK